MEQKTADRLKMDHSRRIIQMQMPRLPRRVSVHLPLLNSHTLLLLETEGNWIFILQELINSSLGGNGVAANATVAEAEGGDVANTRWRRARKLLWQHFIAGYSQPTVLVWSFWWALATGGFYMVSGRNHSFVIYFVFTTLKQ